MTKIIVITGWDRSGSTIIASALGSAPGVLTVGEITNVWDRGFGKDMLCSCGEPFTECEFWGPVGTAAFIGPPGDVAHRAEEAMQRLGNTTLVHRQVRGSSGRLAGSGPYGEMMGKLYAACADHGGAQILVDSSKKPWHTAVAAQLDGFDVYVLHVVRDPRGVAFSFRKRVEYEEGTAMPRHSPTFSSLAWLYRNRLTEREWGSTDRYLRVRYEDFVARPRDTLTDIFEWVGAPATPLPLTAEDHLMLRPSHNVAGNPARFNVGTIALRMDDEWRRSLPAGVRVWVSVLTAWQRRRYAYS